MVRFLYPGYAVTSIISDDYGDRSAYLRYELIVSYGDYEYEILSHMIFHPVEQ
jgi:hypothetical protein